MYDVSLRNKWDEYSIRETAMIQQEKARELGLEEGRQQGIQEGRQQGMKEGRLEGLQEGLQQGRQEGTLAIARELKKIGIPIADIAKGTGLSIDEIEKL